MADPAGIDIMAALAAEPTRSSNDRCVLKRWLDDIPDDTPGKTELVEIVECRDRTQPHFRTIPETMRILRRLGREFGDTTIGAHRAGRCRCFD